MQLFRFYGLDAMRVLMRVLMRVYPPEANPTDKRGGGACEVSRILE